MSHAFKQLVKSFILKLFPSFRPPVLCTPRQRYEGIAINNRIDTSKPYIALTFDDGPSQGVNLKHDFNREVYDKYGTQKVLNILRKYNSKATFFVLGEHIANADKSTLHIIHQDGHEIGVHGWQHDHSLDDILLRQVEHELKLTKHLIREITGQNPVVMRPPRGHADPATAQLIFNGTGMRAVLWSEASYDWENRPTQQALEHVMRTLGPGSIVLMHDIYSSTPETLELLLEETLKRGLICVTLSELISTSNEFPHFTPLPEQY